MSRMAEFYEKVNYKNASLINRLVINNGVIGLTTEHINETNGWYNVRCKVIGKYNNYFDLKFNGKDNLVKFLDNQTTQHVEFLKLIYGN